MSHTPRRQGLYDPAFEHDACGVAFVVDMHGRRSHEHRREGHRRPLQPRAPRRARGGGQHRRRRRHPHPGARRFLRAVVDFDLPPAGAYATGIAFLPAGRRATADAAVDAVEKIVASEGLSVLGWRDVPVDADSLGTDVARRHAVVPPALPRRPDGARSGLDLERRAYVVRKRIEHEVRRPGRPTPRAVYFPSLSCPHARLQGHAHHARSCASSSPTSATSGSRAPSPSCTRGSRPTRSRRGRWPTRTATSPTTARSTRSRATATGCGPARRCSRATCSPGDLERIFPICTPGASDSASFDEVLELLHLGGRSLPHAVLMMIPEAWENHESMDPAKRAFYRFHASLMEPWDGPASIAFTDGTVIGAVLDRNGLRPRRYWVTSDDLVIMASEVGVLDVDPSTVVQKGRLQPGRMFLVDTAAGPHRRRRRDQGRRSPPSTPTSEWLDAGLVHLDDLPDRPHTRYPHESRRPPPADLRLHARGAQAPHRADGPHRQRERSARWAPTRPIAVLSDRPAAAVRLLLPAVRPGHQPAARRHPRGAGHLPRQHARPRGQPARPRARVVPADRAARPDPRQRRAGQARPHQRRRRPRRASGRSWSRACTRWPAAATACATRSTRSAARSSDAIADGATIIVLSDRDSDATLAPIPSLLLTSAVHHHLIREKTRTQVGLVVETGDAREVHHMACSSATAPAAINPYLAFETLEDLIARGAARRRRPRRRHRATTSRRPARACSR